MDHLKKLKAREDPILTQRMIDEMICDLHAYMGENQYSIPPGHTPTTARYRKLTPAFVVKSREFGLIVNSTPSSRGIFYTL